METKFRLESDSVGTLEVPIDAYYGVHTLRGHDNFQITGNLVNYNFILNVVRIKKACAIANYKAGLIKKEISDSIVFACDEVLSGKYKDSFITDSIQGGAGTTINMNVNEVIANIASVKLGAKLGEYLCHPNDHVNESQSTNDVIPTGGRLTIIELTQDLLKTLESLIQSLNKKSKEFDSIIKMGRTQLEDAVPIRLGQEFKAYSSMIKRCHNNIRRALKEMMIVNLGGTAIGTAINTNKVYLREVINELSNVTGYELKQADDLIDGTQNLDQFVVFSGTLKGLAVGLSKMSNDLRLLSSGPKTGFGEITLPAKQNGSSIMPGKINPVIPEVVSQVCFAVCGNDLTVSMAAEAGQLELNAFEPVMFEKIFESIIYLNNAVKTLIVNCIDGIVAHKEHCEELLYSSAGLVTALCPYLGYKKCAELAKEALKTNVKIKDLILEKGLMDKEKLESILDPYKMT